MITFGHKKTIMKRYGSGAESQRCRLSLEAGGLAGTGNVAAVDKQWIFLPCPLKFPERLLPDRPDDHWPKDHKGGVDLVGKRAIIRRTFP